MSALAAGLFLFGLRQGLTTQSSHQ